MRELLKPYFLILTYVVPIIIMFAFNWKQFEVIRPLLSDNSIDIWRNFSILLALYSIIQVIYTSFIIIQKQKIHIAFAIVHLIIGIVFMYGYAIYMDDIYPFNIPNWLMVDEVNVSIFTLMMPSLIHALFIIVLLLTPETSKSKPWHNFLSGILIPITVYFIYELIVPFWRNVNLDEFSQHILVILGVIASILFLFFMVRGLYLVIINKQKSAWLDKSILYLLICFFLPLIGLILSSTLFGTLHIFGDFHHYWFFILSIVNGIILQLPNSQSFYGRLSQFCAKSVLLTFSFYFFVVFLPYIPLSVPLLLLFGVGILVMTPLFLFAIHLHQLIEDFIWLSDFWPRLKLGILAIICFSIIPVIITFNFQRDAHVLNDTLDYIYSPNYSKEFYPKIASISKTLEAIKSQKRREENFIMNAQIPYISSYFKWIVLDNNTLSDSKIQLLEKVFLGHSTIKFRDEDNTNKLVNISSKSVRSHYDKQQQAWVSWLELELTNESEFQAEFFSTFSLPAGCFISDYYLYVEDRREPGILAERKSAMWIYSQIRAVRRDPGLLYYMKNGNVGFRVFPFAKNEVRKTGIQFTHKEKFALQIEGHQIMIGSENSENNATSTLNVGPISYISTHVKSNLTKIRRTPYYHFIVDNSIGNDQNKSAYIQRIKKTISENKFENGDAKISVVNAGCYTFELSENWESKLLETKCEGGFFLDMALKKALVKSYKPSGSYPVFVVVTNNFENAILEDDFTNLKMTFPEQDEFYEVDTNGKWHVHSFLDRPMDRKKDEGMDKFLQKEVLAYPNIQKPLVFLRNNNEPEILVNNDKKDVANFKFELEKWESGLVLQGNEMFLQLHPDMKTKDWLGSVRNSFQSHIMSPQTSFIVVENEAQKLALQRKQDQVLSGHPNLDPGEDMDRMSEPSLSTLFFLALMILALAKINRLF